MNYAVGISGIVLGVRDHDYRGTLTVKFGKQFHDLGSVFRVEVTCGLVGKNESRLGDDGACYGHTLLLTSGELLREVLGPVAYVHAFQHVVYTAFALRCGHSEIGQRQFHVFIHVEFVDEVETLKHEPDLALAQAGSFSLSEATSVSLSR